MQADPGSELPERARGDALREMRPGAEGSLYNRPQATLREGPQAELQQGKTIMETPSYSGVIIFVPGASPGLLPSTQTEVHQGKNVHHRLPNTTDLLPVCTTTYGQQCTQVPDQKGHHVPEGSQAGHLPSDPSEVMQAGCSSGEIGNMN